MRPIISHTIGQRRASTFFWSLGIVIYTILVTAVYKSFINSQTVKLGSTVENLPATVKSFVKINGNFTTPAGFLGSEPYYVVLPIIFLILAINLGSRLLASEESSGTLELLLARPISRGRLLSAKALAGTLILAGINVIAGVAMTLFTWIFSVHIAVAYIWETQAVLFLLALIFGSLAFMLTAIGRLAQSSAMGIAVLLAIGGYVLTSLSGAVHWLKIPAELLPYYYYEPDKILNGNFTFKPAIGYLIGALIFGLISWRAFRRRDIGS